MSAGLESRRALVTGASGGIGEAIAAALHEAGAHVILHGRRREKLEELAARLGGRADVETADLGEAGAADELIKRIEAAGGLDVLVNNAGITRDQLAMRMKDEDWQAVMEVNLASSFRLIRAALRGMMKRRFGRIVNVTSVVGTTGNPGQANYAAAKAGLVGMSKSIAAEVAARGVTVNCVAPGFIETPMTDVLNETQRTAILGRIPQNRLGRPAEVAAGVVFLAGDGAAYITGQTLHINGGMAMV